ncbi:hypothetical protein Hypma_006055 [Hypsizygus marmoreus]|uniref:Uncharacterized protein n=1 Tax=Hypsizygus marmoreus TaxID=39966 RepID=A0A369JVT1_HYPMA|nr:hypothetical protein Hypma_006055 [Hypsizygus marmoreus]
MDNNQAGGSQTTPSNLDILTDKYGCLEFNWDLLDPSLLQWQQPDNGELSASTNDPNQGFATSSESYYSHIVSIPSILPGNVPVVPQDTLEMLPTTSFNQYEGQGPNQGVVRLICFCDDVQIIFITLNRMHTIVLLLDRTNSTQV